MVMRELLFLQTLEQKRYPEAVFLICAVLSKAPIKIHLFSILAFFHGHAKCHTTRLARHFAHL